MHFVEHLKEVLAVVKYRNLVHQKKEKYTQSNVSLQSREQVAIKLAFE